jgi:hypothetical protein
MKAVNCKVRDLPPTHSLCRVSKKCLRDDDHIFMSEEYAVREIPLSIDSPITYFFYPRHEDGTITIAFFGRKGDLYFGIFTDDVSREEKGHNYLPIYIYSLRSVKLKTGNDIRETIEYEMRRAIYASENLLAYRNNHFVLVCNFFIFERGLKNGELKRKNNLIDKLESTYNSIKKTFPEYQEMVKLAELDDIIIF